MPLWEKTLVNPQKTVRYIYNTQDARQKRVDEFNRSSGAANSFLKRLEHKDDYLPFMNSLIIDDVEVVFILPSRYGEPKSWVSVKSKVVTAFQRFNYPMDRVTLA
jgi:hypothetical protein